MRKKFATLSTTSLMRQAGERAGWSVNGAVSILRSWSYDHPNAKSAIAIVVRNAAGCEYFAIEPRTAAIVGVQGTRTANSAVLQAIPT